MNDSDHSLAKTPDANSEPPSSPASAPARGPSLIDRFKGLLNLRTMSLRDDLEEALEDGHSGDTTQFSESERTILQNVLNLSKVTVSDVMVERVDIQAVDAELTLGGLLAKFRLAGHSRLPVYEESLDNIIGFIHVKDALQKITLPVTVEDDAKELPVKLVSTALRQKIGKLDLLRTAMFVPTSMPAGDLLQSMRVSRVHMAIIVDEYGGTDGLVTIEDLLEVLVGDIEDEHDELEAALIRKVGIDTYIADARAELSDVQALIGPDFLLGADTEHVETIGGLIFDLAGHVPAKGEMITDLEGFDVEILASDSRRIKRLRIRRKRVEGEPQILAITDQRPDDQKMAAE